MTEPLTRNVLLDSYNSSGKPRDQWLVGAEFERHLLRPDGTPLPYSGERGVRWLLETLSAHPDWTVQREGEHPIALQGHTASVTLEPGAQFELSGSADGALSAIDREARAFTRDVAEALAGSGVRQIGLGYTPFADIDAIEWVPKGRYVVMRDHLGATGKLAHHMMKGTAAVQATYDYADEAGCAQKVRLATALAPLTTAMFANSPWKKGRPTGWVSVRGHIWTQTDPARTGLPSAASAFSFERWVDYLLDVPMMFRRDPNGAWASARGQTFRQWMDSATEPAPGWDDWELHLTSVFPEIRVKHTIEVRGADCVNVPLAMSFVALFKGLFYCELALDGATALAEEFAATSTSDERFAAACRDGLKAVHADRTLANWAEQLLDLADGALERCAPGDRVWLKPLIAQVETGESPGHTLLRKVGQQPTPQALMDATEIRA